jgi:hypothetical protein
MTVSYLMKDISSSVGVPIILRILALHKIKNTFNRILGEAINSTVLALLLCDNFVEVR